jgi:transposase
MSTRVYLSKNDCQRTQEKDTPLCIRIPRSRATIKDLHHRLQHAYRRDAARLVRRITVRIDLLVHDVPVARLCERWGRSPACLYAWHKAFLLHGRDRLGSHHSGGRPPKLTPRPKTRLGELLDAGPLVVGWETAWWKAVLLRVLLWRECGVLYNRQYGCTLRHTLGFALQKARFVSAHLDAAKRRPWLADTWPAIVRAAKRCNGMLLLEDEASFAQGGSLRSPWARRGQQPAVPTSGKRTGAKVFGAMESFSGRLFSQGIEGRLHSASYQAFLQGIMAHTTAHLVLIHDGARSHTSAATQAFLLAHSDRLTAYPLPS